MTVATIIRTDSARGPRSKVVEFSMPGEIGTVMVDRPAGLPEVLEPRGRQR
jgi:hypothetical protein